MENEKIKSHYEDIAEKVMKFFDDKYNGEFVITNFAVAHSFDNNNDNNKSNNLECSYKLTLRGRPLTIGGDGFISFFDLPSEFRSTVSFDNAFEKAKIYIDTYFNAQMMDMSEEEIKKSSLNLIKILSKERKNISISEYQTIIDHYIDKDNFVDANKFQTLKDKYHGKKD